MFKTVRALITEQVLTYARGEMPGGFADKAGITAWPQNFEYLTRTELTRDRIFHAELVNDF